MQIPPFELERYLAKWEFSVPFTMCSSDCETLRMDELFALADDECRELWRDLRLGYTEPLGHLLLREEIAQMYPGLGPENVLCFAGAEEAIFVLVNVLLEAGDHAIACWPGYQSLYEIARSTGAEVSLIELKEEHGWQIQLEEVIAAVRPNTKAIIVNAPHNPTGTLPTREVFQELTALADKIGAVLVCDEVYRYLEHDPRDRLPSAAELSDKAASIGVMSKAFGLAGLRVGWVVSRDQELLKRLSGFKDYTTICNSAPSEVLTLIALRNAEKLVKRNRLMTLENLALLDDFTKRTQTITWVRPTAGCIAFPRLLSGNVDEIAERMATEAGVLILPGTAYGHSGNHFRIGFGRSNFPEALLRAESWLMGQAV